MIVIAGILIGVSLSFETLGFYFRGSGLKLGMGSIGYSIHVQFATISRLGTFLGFPILGWMIDKGSSIEKMLLFPISTSITFFLLCSLCLCDKKFENKIDQVFIFMANKMSRLSISCSTIKVDVHSNAMKKNDKTKLLLLGAVSYIIIVGGIYTVFLLATMWNAYRATLLQVTPALTALGTLISVIYFDPKVSSLLDRKTNQSEVFATIIKARVCGMLILLTIVSVNYFFYVI